MLTLGIETATDQVSVALGGHEGVLGLVEITRKSRHAETLAPAVVFLCQHAGLELAELGLIAVDVGPGRFTGMRVGLAAAKAFAQALRLPMVGVSSLDLLAFTQRQANRLVVPVIDAGKGEVFWSSYLPVPGGVQQVDGPRVGRAEELASELLVAPKPTLYLGDGAYRYRTVLAEAGHVEWADERYPSAGPLVTLAHARGLREDWVRPDEIVPMYLRPPDAVINWQTRASASRGGRP